VSRTPRVLFIAPVEPWCRENGSSLITADLLDALARSDVELLPLFIRRPPPGYDREAPEGMEGILLDIPGLPRWQSVLRAAGHLAFPLRYRFDNRLVASRLLETVRREGFEPDIVHVEHLPLVDMGHALSQTLRRPLVYRAHNIESRLWARRLGGPDLLKRPIVRRIEESEAEAIGLTDLTLLISEGDREWARERAPGARSELLPCTLRLERYDAVPRTDPVFDHQICFVGGLDWAPNEDGLRWFVDEVFPLVLQREPSAGLVVLARGSHERDWLRDRPSIHLLPPESRAAEVFASSHVSVAPLFQGGGVRIKIPESLAVECPVVATHVGAEGHELPGLTRTDDATDFAEACLEYLTPREGREELRTRLRSAVETHYGATHQAGRLIEYWSEAART
jgi:glycosyltransferase involved in cell wall biosynthesis